MSSMLSKEEIRLLKEILQELELEGDKNKLRTKISLIVDQLDVMEKAQEEIAKIQEQIVKINGDENEKEK